jgi:hypothetical protein
MDTVRFVGVVVKGCGKFSVQLRLPTKDQLSVAIRDWPAIAAAGTLNVHVEPSGFPLEYLANFKEPSFRHLDSRRFAPEAELPWADIGNNTLPPLPERPDRGRAQVWRASITNLRTKDLRICWMLRRMGSGLRSQLELVAHENLRAALTLLDGSPVEVTIEGAWVVT